MYIFLEKNPNAFLIKYGANIIFICTGEPNKFVGLDLL